MSVSANSLPESFPVEMKQSHYFLDILSGPFAIWTVRILALLIFAGLIAWWIYLEYKNRPEDR